MYDSMVTANGYFKFQIVCYHYETRTDHKGRITGIEMVVTHRATELYKPHKC